MNIGKIPTRFFKKKERTAKWLNTGPNPCYSPFDNTLADIYVCSNCGVALPERLMETCKYCYNCGCKMEVDKNELGV